jgi:hypothetical protein
MFNQHVVSTASRDRRNASETTGTTGTTGHRLSLFISLLNKQGLHKAHFGIQFHSKIWDNTVVVPLYRQD